MEVREVGGRDLKITDNIPARMGARRRDKLIEGNYY